MQLTEKEKELLAAYWLADDRAKYDALRILQNNRRKTETVGKIISIASALGKTVEEVLEIKKPLPKVTLLPEQGESD